MDETTKTEVMTIRMQSPAFGDGMIPRGTPVTARTLAGSAMGGDSGGGPQPGPDRRRSGRPSGTFVHWVLYNLSARAARADREHARMKTAQRGQPGRQRFRPDRLRGPLPAERHAPLLLHALRRWTRISTCRRARPRPLCSTPWTTTSSPRARSWAGTRGKAAIDGLLFTIYYLRSTPRSLRGGSSAGRRGRRQPDVRRARQIANRKS